MPTIQQLMPFVQGHSNKLLRIFSYCCWCSCFPLIFCSDNFVHFSVFLSSFMWQLLWCKPTHFNTVSIASSLPPYHYTLSQKRQGVGHFIYLTLTIYLVAIYSRRIRRHIGLQMFRGFCNPCRPLALVNRLFLHLKDPTALYSGRRCKSHVNLGIRYLYQIAAIFHFISSTADLRPVYSKTK